MNERSGTLSRSGVCTVITATSKSRRSAGSQRRAVPGGQRARELLVGDVLHERAAGGERLDALRCDVVADHRQADLDRAYRDRETDVALPHHDDLRGAGVDLRDQLGRVGHPQSLLANSPPQNGW